MTALNSSAPAAGSANPAGAEAPPDVVRNIPCPWCGQRLPIHFVAEEWDVPYVNASGGHPCPAAPTRHLLDESEVAA